jgi:hypothetical protein
MISVLLVGMVMSVVISYLALAGSVMWLSYISDLFLLILVHAHTSVRRSQWPRGLRRRSVTARLLGLWFRIPKGAWTLVCCACCVLSGKGLCDELITRPEESYRLCCVVVCDLETS